MSSAPAQDRSFFYVLDEPIRILLVDDDPILREFGSVHLASETAEVLTAQDGVEAMAILETTPVDLMLLDLEMPRMDGFSVLERLRARPETARLPVIVVTGHEDVAAIDSAYRRGATSFVVKPINWRQLSYQIKYVRRASSTEDSLAVGPDTGVTASAMALVRDCVDFMREALAAAPHLKPSAEAFARRLATHAELDQEKAKANVRL